MNLLAILFVAEVILIASCETSKKVKEEVKLEAEKVVKKLSLKERLQNIAKKSKRAKSYYTTSSWNSWDRRTTDYPDRLIHDYNDSTQYPPSPSQYPGYGTTRCDYTGCDCYADWQCRGSLNCHDNQCFSDYYYTATPAYNKYKVYTTRGYVNAEEYRDEEEENERDEERVNPRGKDSAVQPNSK